MDPIVDALCTMPTRFHERGDISMIGLLRETGYNGPQSGVSEQDIEKHLRQHPDLVRVWTNYSEDQRCSPAWYLAQPGTSSDSAEGWRVGYYAHDSRLPETLFPDEFVACAFYIAREVETLFRLSTG